MNGSVVIRPGRLSGTLTAPPSKSYAHRAVIAASLAAGESRLSNIELSQDVEATIGAMRALGADIRLGQAVNGRVEACIRGIESKVSLPLIDCRESGSTLRFLIPVALALCSGAVFTGSGRLGQRPLGPYLDIFKEQRITADFSQSGFPLTVKGALKPGEFHIPGNISSQFVTGLLMALPLLHGDSIIRVEGSLESKGYVDITLDVLESFGVVVREIQPGGQYRVAGDQTYRAVPYAVEGDWSQAAYPLLMGLLGGSIAIAGLKQDSKQGDRIILDIYRDMGGDIRWEDGLLTARPSTLRAVSVDVSQCPDLAPAIAAAMAVAQGESRITGGKRLRDKESDRLASIASCLTALGGDVRETENGLVIRGRNRLAGGSIPSFNDHRIAMMAAGVSPLCAGPVSIQGHHAVAKSWPGFWDDFRGLGGRLL